MTLYLAPESTPAGLWTAVASAITATTLLIAALAGLIPVLRASRRTEAKVDQVHRLVNENLTATKVSELGAMRRELTALRMVARMQERAGIELSPEDALVIAHSEARIAELTAEIAGRQAHDEAERVITTQMTA